MKIPLALVKFHARRLYYGYYNWADQYDCGREVFEHINPEARKMRLKLESLIDEVKERNPNK